jgi:integrase
MFRRRKNGKPYGNYYYYHPVTGDRVSSGTQDKARAAQLLRDLQNEAHDRKHGKYVERWEEVAPRWMELNQHLANYRSQKEYHAFWLERLTGLRLNEIDAECVHREILTGRKGRYAVNLKERVSANSTANLYVNFVGKILRFGNVAPPKLYRYPDSKKSKPWLRPEEWPALRDAMGDDLRLAITYALASGFRIENIIGFQWTWLHANDTRTYLPMEVTKTDQPYGIPNNRAAQAVFAELRRQPVRHQTHAFTHLGQPWKYATLRKALKVACKRAGVPILTPHSTRHTFRTWLTQEGVADSIVRRLGCWQQPQGADNRYLHLDVEPLRRFAEVLDPLLCLSSVTTAPENAAESSNVRIL